MAVATAAALLCLAAVAADKKQKSKPAVVELQAFKITLEGSDIDIEGTVHNNGDRTIEKLVLSFHFFDSDHQPISTLKLEVDHESIDPGRTPRSMRLHTSRRGRYQSKSPPPLVGRRI